MTTETTTTSTTTLADSPKGELDLTKYILTSIASDKLTDDHRALFTLPTTAVIKTNNPTKFWYLAGLPVIDTTGVPDGFLPVVTFAITSARERILRRRVTAILEGKYTAEWVPAEIFSVDSTIAEASGSGLTTFDGLLALFKLTTKGKEIEVKLAALKGPAAKIFATKIARFHAILKALTGKGENALTPLTPKDLDFILLSIPEDDETSAYASWVSRRIEEVRPAVEALQDSDEAL